MTTLPILTEGTLAICSIEIHRAQEIGINLKKDCSKKGEYRYFVNSDHTTNKDE